MATIDPPAGNVIPLRRDDHAYASRIAIDWLTDRHRKAWNSAFESSFKRLQPDDADNRGFDEELMTMLAINLGESLIARGEIYVKGEMRSINAHLLGRDGPYLSPEQQRWIAQLAERPLRLYRATDVRVGEGLTLVDEFDSTSDPLVVRERGGSRSIRPGALLGARVMHLSDHLELSGALYPFAALREGDVLGRVRAALDTGSSPADKLKSAELEIARCWLAQYFEPSPMPELRDGHTDEPILLVTDHYRVADAAALADVLAAQPDVIGDAKQGWHRVRAVGGVQLTLAAINRGKSASRIEVFYHTQRMADEGRAWFEGLAGAAVQHLTRELGDPRSTAARRATSRKGRAAPAQDPREVTALIEQMMHRHYANWADEPIPYLSQQTPRQAIGTPAGLERVKGLLRTYESGEAEMARADGRPPVSYQFLWDALGITR